MGKTYVKILAEHDENGNIKPLMLTWTDGRKFEIDKIKDVRQAPSLKGGGLGRRYTCKIMGREVYLFCVEGKWFVER